jgi:hypothetical protein
MPREQPDWDIRGAEARPFSVYRISIVMDEEVGSPKVLKKPLKTPGLGSVVGSS